MFDPVQITPAQFYGPVYANTGPRRLLLAILDDAVHLLMTMRRTATARREDVRAYGAQCAKERAQEEEAWFASEEVYWGSFVFVCDHLDINADWLRDKLLDTATTVARQCDSSRQPATRGAYRKHRLGEHGPTRIPTSDYYLTKGIRAGAEPMGRTRREVGAQKRPRRAL